MELVGKDMLSRPIGEGVHPEQQPGCLGTMTYIFSVELYFETRRHPELGKPAILSKCIQTNLAEYKTPIDLAYFWTKNQLQYCL